jgi:type IV pilus assembly protein PilN
VTSRVNLLPPDIRQGQRTRRTATLVLLLGVVVVGLILGFWVLQGLRLSGVNDDIAAQEQTNASIRSDIASLQKYADLQAEAQKQQALLATAYKDEVAFSGLLMDLSVITPSDSFLTSLSVQVTGIDPAAPPTETPLVGSIQLAGEAIGYDTIATWLTHLEQVRGWVNPWIPSVSKVEGIPDDQSFTASVDLTTDAMTERGRGVTEGG